jgi:hypothetical protein
MFDYAVSHDATRAAQRDPGGTRRRRVTEPPPGHFTQDPDRRRRAVHSRSATFDAAEPGRRALVVLLPSGDAATILLLCAQAAELAG